MNELRPDILHRIGNTTLLPLRNVAPGNGSRTLLKLDFDLRSGRGPSRAAFEFRLSCARARQTEGTEVDSSA